MTLPSGFYGGWSLIADTCPSGTDACGQRSCCPAGAVCDTMGSSYSNLCCPGNNDCSNAVKSLPQCADSTWILFSTIKDLICCQPGQVALQPQGSSLQGSCVDAAGTYPASLLAPSATHGASNSSAATNTAVSSRHSILTSSTAATSSHLSSATPTASAYAHSALPIKTIAGIAVGGAVLLIIAFALCCVCLWRRNKRSRQPVSAATVNWVPYGPYGSGNGMAREVPYDPYDYSKGAKSESYAMDNNVGAAKGTDYAELRGAEVRELSG